MAVRAAACLSGMLVRQRVKRPAPPSFTFYIARSSAYSSALIRTPTTVTPLLPAMRTSTLSMSKLSSAVGACPVIGSATVLAVLTTIPMSSSCHRRKAKALAVLTVTPIRPREIPSMYVKASTPSPSNSSRKRFSPGRNARQNIVGPVESPC